MFPKKAELSLKGSGIVVSVKGDKRKFCCPVFEVKTRGYEGKMTYLVDCVNRLAIAGREKVLK